MNSTAKRINHISVQHGHGVACDNYRPLPFRTGYEQVLSSRVDNLFAISAKAKGKVIKLSKNSITVLYDEDITETYELGIIHGSVSGVTVPHTVITDLKEGQSFKQKDIIVYNEGYFERDILNPSTVVYKAGAISKVALLESSDTNEDSCVISNSLAVDMSTPNTGFRPIILGFTDIIHNLVQVGDTVTPDTILCTIESAISSELDKGNSDTISALRSIAAANPKSKHFGTISKIEIIYHGSTDDMSDSLKEITLADTKSRTKRSKQLNSDIPKNGMVDTEIHVGGNKLLEKQLTINIYIDGKITLGTGDKVVFANALKSTIGKISNEPMIAKDGNEIQALFGYQSVSDRIVLSSEISGIMNRLLSEMSLKMSKIYRG